MLLHCIRNMQNTQIETSRRTTYLLKIINATQSTLEQ